MAAAEATSPAPVWTSRVVCGHGAVLGRSGTADAWAEKWAAVRTDGSTHGGCATAVLDGWQVGIRADDADVATVLAAVAQARAAGPPASVLVRAATRTSLPDCSILIADGEQLAALSWGLPLGMVELGPWEYAVTGPADEPTWTPLAAGSVAALDPCGPTVFLLHAPALIEEVR